MRVTVLPFLPLPLTHPSGEGGDFVSLISLPFPRRGCLDGAFAAAGSVQWSREGMWVEHAALLPC